MSELTLFYILVAITAPILFLWLVCWLCTRKHTVVIDPAKDLAKAGLKFVAPTYEDLFEDEPCGDQYAEDQVLGNYESDYLDPEDVKAEAHDSLFLRFAEDKLTELKRK